MPCMQAVKPARRSCVHQAQHQVGLQQAPAKLMSSSGCCWGSSSRIVGPRQSSCGDIAACSRQSTGGEVEASLGGRCSSCRQGGIGSRRLQQGVIGFGCWGNGSHRGGLVAGCIGGRGRRHSRQRLSTRSRGGGIANASSLVLEAAVTGVTVTPRAVVALVTGVLPTDVGGRTGATTASGAWLPTGDVVALAAEALGTVSGAVVLLTVGMLATDAAGGAGWRAGLGFQPHLWWHWLHWR